MITILTSSPCIGHHGPLNPANGFIDTLKKYMPQNPRVLSVASDPDDFEHNDDSAADRFRFLNEAGITPGICCTLDHRNPEKAAELVKACDVIMLNGGHVPTQNRFFNELGLRELLKDYNGVVMGISAGSMNSSDVVYAQPELEGESIDPNYQKFLPGLGLTKVQICPHYYMVKDDPVDGRRLYEDITAKDSMGHRFFIFPDGTYLLGIDGDETIFGECFTMADGVMKKICDNNESVKP